MTTPKPTNKESQKGKPQQGLIQEVAIGSDLSDQMLTENQIKRG